MREKKSKPCENEPKYPIVTLTQPQYGGHGELNSKINSPFFNWDYYHAFFVLKNKSEFNNTTIIIESKEKLV